MKKQKRNNKSVFWLMLLMLLITAGVLSWQGNSAAAEINNTLNGITNWSDEIHISTNSANGAFVPVIAYAPDGTVMVVYRHRTVGGFNIPYFTQSLGGSSWSNPAAVRNSPIDIPQVSVDFDTNSLAHAVWRTDTDIFHADENSWPGAGTPIVSTLESVLDPDIEVADDNTIHVVWAQGDTLSNIYHAYSQSGGAGWTLSPALATDTRKSIAPTVSMDNNGDVHVVWEERIFNVGQNEFITEIRYKKGTWVGNNLTFDANPTIISNSNINSNRPEIIAVGSDQVHVSYMEQVSEDEQYAMYGFYNGTVWLSPVPINNTAVGVNQSDPFFLITSLDVCGNSAYVFFHGSLSPTSKEQIQTGNSADGWNFIEQVTSSSNRSLNPSFVCNGSQQLFLAFTRIEESGPNAGTNQIYFLSQTGGGSFLPAIFSK